MTEHQHINDELLNDDNGSALNFVESTHYLEPELGDGVWVADFALKGGGSVNGTGETQLEAGRNALQKVSDVHAADMAKYT